MTGTHRFPPSDHCDGQRFFNVMDGHQSPSGILAWILTRPASNWPHRLENIRWPSPERVGANQIAATFVGHASFMLQVGGLCILTDPIWSERASPVPFAGPKRVRDPGQALADLPAIDLVLVSHNHYDHLDLPTLRQVKQRWNPPVITGLGNADYLAPTGLLPVTELDWWQSVTVRGVTVTYVPAQHFSARGPFDRNRALWGGFVIQGGGSTVYFAADSGWCDHFAEIGRRFPGIDLALIPIGAYQPRNLMRLAHIDPEEAVQAHLALGARRSLGMHFGTFRNLTDEPIDEPVQRLRHAAAAAGLAEGVFDVLDFGQTQVIDR
jgi:L-ascorbate metabolism protein UlaG (beta-lactamase superfamily)